QHRVRDPLQVDLDDQPRGDRGRPGRLGGGGHVGDHGQEGRDGVIAHAARLPRPAQTLTVGSCAAIRRTKTLTSSGYGGSRVRYEGCSAWWSPTRTALTCSPRSPR